MIITKTQTICQKSDLCGQSLPFLLSQQESLPFLEFHTAEHSPVRLRVIVTLGASEWGPVLLEGLWRSADPEVRGQAVSVPGPLGLYMKL